ncbi:MAG: glycosyltransferase family 4 protein [Verrucomicrobia bacterium]|nr:glycosyltransferase family 4 protein [Verrucomicrobiota bacterium]
MTSQKSQRAQLRVRVAYFYRRLRREVLNHLRQQSILRWRWLAALVKLISIRDPVQRFARMANICNAFESSRLITMCLRKHVLAYGDRADIYPEKHAVIRLRFSVIVKPYVSEHEKGILLVLFQAELEKLLNRKVLATLEQRYHIIFCQAYTGFLSMALVALAARTSSRFYVMPVHTHEQTLCRHLGSCCRMLPFSAASWVREGELVGYKGRRDIDCLMVANFANYKRHWLLFKVLRKLPPEVTAVCVGVPLKGRTAATVREEAREYGVSDRVTIVERAKDNELRELFQRAKVFCAFSDKEGSFVAVAESLLAGTPVVMFKNAIIGTKDAIDQSNGALVSSATQARSAVLHFLNGANHAEIRANAKGIFSSTVSCAKLNELLKDDALRSGGKWSEDVEPFYLQHLYWYYHSQDGYSRTQKDYSWLKSVGIEIELATTTE